MSAPPSGQPSLAQKWIPSRPTIPLLKAAVQTCEGCDLYRHATQAVFGDGPADAPVVMVGEQPGAREDRAGKPFVGPAGELLDKALAAAGVDRGRIYLTNAVKHFKFEERGKRRLHKKASMSEVKACKPWLEAEMSLIKPEVIVCLGATAAQALLGSKYRLTKERGKFVEHPLAPLVTATIHPSAVLRAPDAEQRHQEYRKFVADLQGVRKVLASKK